ncbi:acyltransferase-domain-containing protein [Polychytrium aggregatum]|uniref:acyltransferase-domain-containing protein n=1 Tax=Polychytrium aggregatum TaxID=110093 RepID=UPI0022FE6D5D|nr:acyltransferase-domain-containing protein [Polychytrium aggregatum]KAI9205402.1 acyltransferase-domain-containing protein [Polychytrium aggregatum]
MAVSTPEFLLRLIVFVLVFDLSSVAVNLAQFVVLPLALVPATKLIYRLCIRESQRLWVTCMLSVLALLSPVELVLTGDWEAWRTDSLHPGDSVVIANHQIYTDWMYLWAWAHLRNAHGDVKIVLKRSLRNIPVVGWGMQFFEFIFLKRKWAEDRDELVSSLERARRDPLPTELIFFPEGTVITSDTSEKSRSYHAKAGYPWEHPRFVLVPRITGLWTSLNALRGQGTRTATSTAGRSKAPLRHLYDCTIVYDGIKPGDCPYDKYPILDVFLKGTGPARVFIHVSRFEVASIPGFTEAESRDSLEDGESRFSEWLLGRFQDKDKLIEHFHATGQFVENPGRSLRIPVAPSLSDALKLVALIVTEAALAWLAFRAARSAW